MDAEVAGTSGDRVGRSEDKEKLVQELIAMGFSKSLVQEVVDKAGDVPSDLIIEQLLTSNMELTGGIPVVEDDGDQMWEDVAPANYKMVIVINTSLNMGVGKIASQSAHAALGLYGIVKRKPELKEDLKHWDQQGSRKIVVGAKSTAELTKLCEMGHKHQLPYFRVIDAGLTEVEPESFTAMAFFGPDDRLNPITGKLRLLK